MQHLMMDPECRVCGCTEEDCSQCIERTGFPCSWAEEDLCSACVGIVKSVSVTCYFKDGTGNKQTMTFEMDMIVGVDEEDQLKTTSLATLKDKGFLNTSNHKINYKFLNDI